MKPDGKLVEYVLITRCQLRDRQALAELIERYERPVRYFIRRLGTVRSRIHHAKRALREKWEERP